MLLNLYLLNCRVNIVKKQKNTPEFLKPENLLSYFGKNIKSAKQNYKRFVEAGVAGKIQNPNNDVIGGFLLGDSNFVNWVKDTFLSKKAIQKEIPQLKALRPKVSPDLVVEQVGIAFKCDSDRIITKGRKNNKEREIAIYLARTLCGLSGVELGKYFGGVSGSLITIMTNRIREEIQKNRKLKKKVKVIKEQILNIGKSSN